MGRRVLAVVRRWWLDALGVLGTVLYAWPTLIYPFGTDHPIHWYIGRRLLDGEMPYAESAVSTKPPGAFLVHSVSILLFGEGMSSIRVTELIFIVALGFMIATFRLRRSTPDGRVVDERIRRPGEIGAACLASALLYWTFFDQSDTGHPELWQGFFMLLSAWVIVRAPDMRISWKRAFWAGFIACFAVTFKHVAFMTGVLGGMMVVIAALAHRDGRGAWVNAGAYTSGVLVVLGLTLLPFWLTGTFDAFWELMVDYILRYASHGIREYEGPPPWMTMDKGLFSVVVPLAMLWGGLAVRHASKKRRDVWLGVAIFLLLMCAFGSVFVQKRAQVSRMFSYHFITVVPFLALALVWGLRAALGRSGVAQLMVVLALFAAAFVYEPNGVHDQDWTYRQEWVSYVEYRQGERSWREHHTPHLTSRLDSFIQIHDIAEYLRPRMQPGDTLCVDGFIMALYPLTGMRCPSRFISGPGVREWEQEFAQTLQEHPPTFFVTFGTRGRIRQLQRRGYSVHHIRYENRSWYTVLELRPETAEEGAP